MSGRVRSLELDYDRVFRLSSKILRLLEREGRGKNSRVEGVIEYYALRFVGYIFESRLKGVVVVDNEAEILAFLKTLVAEDV
jgi:hypothetical protein